METINLSAVLKWIKWMVTRLNMTNILVAMFSSAFSGLIDCENTDILEGINNSDYSDNI